MNYIGSKLSLLSFIENSIDKVTNKNYNSLCDLFAGTGVVGRHFKKKGCKITSNDIQNYSYVLNRHYIGNHKKLIFNKLKKEIPNLKTSINQDKTVCDYLSNLTGTKGFIYNNYCYGGNARRMYYSDYNGMLCDSIRIKIEEWKKCNKINNDEYYFLLTSLLESIDKVANTASVYGAYLKSLKNSAKRKLKIIPAELIENNKEHNVFNDDANKIVSMFKGDILYLDPPYNSRQYCTNYHLLETIARYDNPEIKGKTGLRNYESEKSKYCSKTYVKESFGELIKNANAKYIFLSYNNEGLLSLHDIKEIMSQKGEYGFFTQNYNRFKADNSRKYFANKTIEYLHYVKCNIRKFEKP